MAMLSQKSYSAVSRPATTSVLLGGPQYNIPGTTQLARQTDSYISKLTKVAVQLYTVLYKANGENYCLHHFCLECKMLVT